MADDAHDGVFHDEVEIEDFEYDEETETFTYPCPCGDLFSITKEDLTNGDDVARCPSCSLIVRVIYESDYIDSLSFNKQKAKRQSLLTNNNND